MPSTLSPRVRFSIGKAAPSGTSQLDQLIATLTPGYGPESYGDLNYSWPGDTGAFLAWFVRGHWVAGTGKLYWFCKAAGNGLPYRLYQYDEATNQITRLFYAAGPIPGTFGTDGGHGYDVSTLLDDELYVMPIYSEAAAKWNGSTFVQATGQWTSAISSARALCAHPNLYGAGQPGLVTCFTGQLRTWKKAGGTGLQWAGLGQLKDGSTNISPADSQACYSPTFDAVLYTGGTTAPGLAWFVSGGATPSYSLAQGLPVPVHVNSSPINRLVRTRTGTLAILESNQTGVGTGQVFRMSENAARNWTLLPWKHPLSGGTDTANGANNFPVTWLGSKGVFLSLIEQNNGNSPPKLRAWMPPLDF